MWLLWKDVFACEFTWCWTLTSCWGWTWLWLPWARCWWRLVDLPWSPRPHPLHGCFSASPMWLPCRHCFCVCDFTSNGCLLIICNALCVSLLIGLLLRQFFSFSLSLPVFSFLLSLSVWCNHVNVVGSSCQMCLIHLFSPVLTSLIIDDLMLGDAMSPFGKMAQSMNTLINGSWYRLAH